jgi:hypothetical protein
MGMAVKNLILTLHGLPMAKLGSLRTHRLGRKQAGEGGSNAAGCAQGWIDVQKSSLF